MGSRRRSLIVLVLVLALMAGSAWVIADKPTQQGLDLQGGTELVYEARGTPAVPEPTGEDVDRAVELIRDRVDALGVSEPEIARIGQNQLSVGLPQVQNAQDAIDQVGDTSQLFFYDFEPNVISATPGGGEPRPFNRLIDAVREAQEQEPECFEKDGEPLCTSQEGFYYLFDESTLQPIGTDGEPVTDIPTRTSTPRGSARRACERDLFLSFPDEQQPPGTVVEKIPQGYVILREEETPDNPDTDVDESETTPRGWFLLRDRPELTGDQIRNPEQQTDPTTGELAVTFDFTDEGQDAFQEVTRRIAQRGAAKPEAIQATTPEQAAAISDSFAVVLDGEIVSRPIINFRENPDGISGSTGAQISGSFTLQEAQDLAEFLRIGALPVDLTLLSQSTVSATLGQEALDGAILAGLAGPRAGDPLPARLLPVPGLRRGARAVRLRALLPGADQADPDHADAAGDRGTDPHDRRRGRLEHRDLRADQGGDPPRALDAVGDHAGLPQGHRDDHRRERDHPDHGVRPVRPRDAPASRGSRSPSASARSSRCSPPCCSRRRCWRCSGARTSCARRASSALASATPSGSSTSPGCRSTSSRPPA